MSLNKFIKEMVRLEVYSLHLYFVLFYWAPLSLVKQSFLGIQINKQIDQFFC
ncbi:hypothetical protein B4088_6074 [Bacillus cereus]|uniref:Uncharacterized protein n=1 Tax=Bacillus cereus TaxID=1396 RepID=A0A164KR92_BACCE|nr:hypothetical protein B4088_6074 [Bacillus cereus]